MSTANRQPPLPWDPDLALRLHHRGFSDTQIGRAFGIRPNQATIRMNMLVAFGRVRLKISKRVCRECAVEFETKHDYRLCEACREIASGLGAQFA